MAENRYAVVVFDWDGTLIDSASAIVECIQHAAREMGLPVPPRERASHVIGLGLQDSLRRSPGTSSVGYNAFAALYRRHFLARGGNVAFRVRELLASSRRRGAGWRLPPARAGAGWTVRWTPAACARISSLRAVLTSLIPSRTRQCSTSFAPNSA